jgi:beta-phosphoglucomutase
MSCNHLRGVVFDMDGVIIDSHPTHRLAWKQFLQSVDREASDDELEFILEGRKREEILRHFLGDLSSDQIRQYGSRKDEMLRRLGNGTKPIAGVIEFLSSLKEAGVRTALATSAGKTRTLGTLAELHLSDYFDAIVTGDEVVTGKPDPLIYRLAAQRMDEKPQHLVAFEDAVAGVSAATGAGLRCVGLAVGQRAKHLSAAGADPVLPNFLALSLPQLRTLLP